MTHVIKSNVTTTYMVIFEDKYTQIIILFTCCMIDIILLMYSKISYWDDTREMKSSH